VAKLVNNYLDKIDALGVTIINDADEILKAVNLAQLLKSPKEYLTALGNKFIKDHKKEIKTGFDEGKRFANAIIEKS
jgi:hypothetical protein